MNELFNIDRGRISILSEGTPGPGPVVYWMGRDQRADDNWALLHACATAIEADRSVSVLFLLSAGFAEAPLRHYDFMLKGLQETAAQLKEHNIPFEVVFTGSPGDLQPLINRLQQLQPHTLISDFDPLRLRTSWKQLPLSCPHLEVDAHNVVPCRFVSDKKEYAAYTLRPKIHRLLGRFLTGFPALPRFSRIGHPAKPPRWDELRRAVNADPAVPAVDWVTPGSTAGDDALQLFLNGRISRYNQQRNDPLSDAQSGLSPWLHFGQIAPQRAAWQASLLPQDENRDAFLEELVVRRELADNFCFYEPHYDSPAGFHPWAQSTIEEHRNDPRNIYTFEELEAARSPDPLWNAAQLQLVREGKMHGYLRMYWAKQLLLWTPDAPTALQTANRLNDRYSLDGRDPNGYAGTAWSIGGVHDRAWPSRPVFGKVRYMNFNGCKRKFDVKQFIGRYTSPQPEPEL